MVFGSIAGSRFGVRDPLAAWRRDVMRGQRVGRGRFLLVVDQLHSTGALAGTLAQARDNVAAAAGPVAATSGGRASGEGQDGGWRRMVDLVGPSIGSSHDAQVRRPESGGGGPAHAAGPRGRPARTDRYRPGRSRRGTGTGALALQVRELRHHRKEIAQDEGEVLDARHLARISTAIPEVGIQIAA